MVPEDGSPRIVRFHEFTADLNSCELFKDGVKIRLTEQPFQLLAMLLEHPGEVVSREALRHRLWPEDTFVDFDRSLNTAASKLRDALGDTAENPRYIQTLPRRGYRFVAALDKRVPEDARVADAGCGQPIRKRSRPYVTWAALVIGLLGGTALIHLRWRESDVPVIVPTVKLTNDGLGKSPILATDGPRIYFSAWRGGPGDAGSSRRDGR
jgi:DNA-binding winged helix-turn-helix (wHTH) protein